MLVGAALAAILGWRVGLVSSLVSLIAVVLGGALGFVLGRQILPATQIPTPQHALALMASVIVGILLAQSLVARPAHRLHQAVVATRLRVVNGAGGAALSVGFAVVVVWMSATALTMAPSTQLASAMRGSALLVGLDRTIPADAGPLFQQFESSVGIQHGGRVFTGFGLLPAPAVPLPEPGAVSDDAAAAARESVVRITGRTRCGDVLAGSGVVVADELVMTNAHVLAGVSEPIVYVKDRRIGLPAVPVAYDPVRDTALLRVADLTQPPISLGVEPDSGDLVAVAGYPNAGPQAVKAARVRGVVRASGSDIYDQGASLRQVTVVAGEVIAGDSGGALLSQSGAMVGLVFAASLADGSTGYALTMSEVTAALQERPGNAPISTGACVPGD